MMQVIPKNMYKSFEIEELRITGYKSTRGKMIKVKHGGKTGMMEGKEIDLDGVHISFKEGHFEFGIGGEKNLIKLKEIIEFVLKIESKGKK